MFDFGEYAAYIWPSYIISALVIGGLAAETLISARRWKRRAEERQAQRDRERGS